MFALRYPNTHDPMSAFLMFGLCRHHIGNTMTIAHQHPPFP
jgi:hypothetical protein